MSFGKVIEEAGEGIKTTLLFPPHHPEKGCHDRRVGEGRE